MFKINKNIIILIIINLSCILTTNVKQKSQESTRYAADPKNNKFEFFTAATDLELLHKVEVKLSKQFLKYYHEEEERLDKLETKIREIENRIPPQTGYVDDDEQWIGHVTDGYSVLTDFEKFWSNFSLYSKRNTSEKSMLELKHTLERLEEVFPAEDDLRGALAAIFRLQDTYDISAGEFADGLGPYSHKLRVEELFEMGFLCSGIEDYYHARKWFKEAYYRFPPTINQVGFLDKASLLEYLAWSEYQLGFLENAIKYIKLVLQINPKSEAAKTNLEFWEEDLEKSKTDPKIRKKVYRKNVLRLSRQNSLCQGREKIEQHILDQLNCTILSHKPRFILKPLKVEYAYNDPVIIIYHDLVRDYEIKRIIQKAKPLLNRATVHEQETGKLVFADYRVSKSAWILEEMDDIVASLIQRVGDIVNLNMRYSEALQVANYGMAGQYEPHTDHARSHAERVFKRWGGNRIATMLMYLTDVERGGNTVFTNTGKGVSIKPTKGMGVFWYNLKRNGKGDVKTEHAACPVLLGQKWVSNLWIHEHGQEFLRPCTLNKDD